MKNHITLLVCLISVSLAAQVGINNVSPNASLDITASNQTAPANTDGILVPRVAAFPLTNPTAAQNGMLVYLTGFSAGNPPGFYYWNNITTSWDAVGGGADEINDLSDGINDGTSVFLGNNAGTNDDGGNNNVALGIDALDANTFGVQNTALGYNALTGIITGNGNIALGSNALTGLTAGSSNIAIGRSTMAANSTSIDASGNIAIGSFSMSSLLSGSNNVGLGNSSLNDLTTGRGNAAVGHNSLTQLTSGENNVAHGYRAGIFASSGTNNVFIGESSGRVADAGSFNTYVRSRTGFNSANGSRNVFIGYQAGSNETGSDKLYIDNNSTVAPLIYGDFASRALRINGRFQVNDPSSTGYEFPATDGATLEVLTTDGAGQISWLDPLDALIVNNGLSKTASTVSLGGALNSDTTVSQSVYDLLFDLTGSGSFIIADNGTDHFEMDDAGNGFFGGQTYWRNGSTSGVNVGRVWGTASGIFDLYSAGTLTTRIAASGDSYVSSGSFGIGTNNPVEALDVEASSNSFIADFLNESTSIFADGIRVRLTNLTTTSSNYFVGFYQDGLTLAGRISGNGTGVTYVTTSDARLKTNFENVDNALHMISKMKPQWYEFKTFLGRREMGFLAQELQKVYPQAVSGDENSDPTKDPMMVDYGRITPLLTAGIQELEQKVSALQEENEKIKAQLAKYATLEARISALEAKNEGNTIPSDSTLITKD